MSNSEFCCNPFKQRDHRPESWRLLPITKSLRDQFRLYLGDDTDICLSCKRQLYRTLPSINAPEPRFEQDDSVMQEIEEMGFWSDELEMKRRSFDETEDDLSADESFLIYQLNEERDNHRTFDHHRTEQQRAVIVNDASQVAVVSSSDDHKRAGRSTHPARNNLRKF